MKMTVYRPEELPQELEVDLPERPSILMLRQLIEPHLDGGDLERVLVFWEGQYTDMFVDGMGQLKDLPHNEAATEIYRNNTVVHRPGTDPDTLPDVVGPAVLMERRVWF